MTASGRRAHPAPEVLAGLPEDGGPDWNRLVFEKSPYLLQHAANPVDWRPWGEAAFEAAREQGKPVFVSIGYATCHWCHVMEHESFEDAEVAALMNELFVCVKVDREERPDVDHVYMSVTQALTGSGGWPMTVVLTPDRKPFFAGTYFPKNGRGGRPGMMQLLPAVSEAWRNHREAVDDEAGRIVAALSEIAGGAPGPALDASSMEAAVAQLAQRFDPVHGGFGRAPKFPVPHQLSFLLRWHRRSGDAHALAMVEATLDAMRCGGVYDQVGHGLHRYSTDREWLVPHFEKMLYDQALLIIAAVETFQVTRESRFAELAREVIGYVARELSSPEGAFLSAEDADSEGEEGLFYAWTLDELREVAGEDAGIAEAVFGATRAGNWRDEATGRATGRNVLYLPEALAPRAVTLGMDEKVLRERVERVRLRLLAVRSKRERPFLDDKILPDWNGLMIAALAVAARALSEPSFAASATRAARFVLDRMRAPDGRLLKRWRQGEAALPGVLEDHAFMAWGLVELHQATQDPRWLTEALALVNVMIARFADDANGGFFLSADDGERLPVRPKDVHDGAIPAGSSVAALVLLKLARLTGDASLEERAQGTFRAFSGQIAQAPSASCLMLSALDLALGPSHEVVVAGRRGEAGTDALLGALAAPFLPGVVVLLRPEDDPGAVTRLAPFTEGMAMREGKATAYACSGNSCQEPTTDAGRLAAQVGAR